MSLGSLLPRAIRLGLVVAAALAFLPPLVTRIVMGQAFFLTGRGKLQNPESVVGFFTGLGIPFPELNAAFVSRLEFYGGIALVLGLLTRLVAAGLASTMVVALATADRDSLLEALRMSGDTGLTDVAPFVYLLLLGWLIVSGPGPLSLDMLLARWLRSRGWAPSGVEAAPHAARA